MGSLGWRERCIKCGGETNVEMALSGEALSACGFCGLFERWAEPDGKVVTSGGKGCCTVVLRDTKTVSPGLSAPALREAWRRLGKTRGSHVTGGWADVMVVTRKASGGLWMAGARRGGAVLVWRVRVKPARLLAELIVSGGWSDQLAERLAQRRAAARRLGRGFTMDLGRARRLGTDGGEKQLAPEREEDWGDLPL